MTIPEYGLLFVAAMAAGALNAVAGGGSFFTFPTLLFVGVPSIEANATNTIALWPGVIAGLGAYRKEIGGIRDKILWMGLISIIGGIVGALLLLSTDESTFERMIPFLMLLATTVFALSPRVNRWLRTRSGPTLADNRLAIVALQFIIAVYGGFFGGGIGIMMLALLAISGMEDMNQMNALKLVLNTLLNGVAVITFVLAGAVIWDAALVMIIGAILGGYGGALLAQRVEQIWVRRFVVVVGSFLTVYFFYQYWLA